jgi:CHAT domain-containing protein/tetratricopeptide (TPR) repeat protein
MRKVLIPVLLLGLAGAAARPQPDAAVKAKVGAKIDALVAALNAADPDKALADWPADAPYRATFRRMLPSMVAPPGYTGKIEEHALSGWKMSDTEVVVRFRYVMLATATRGKHEYRSTVVFTATFARAPDGVRWASLVHAATAAAEAIRKAGTHEEAVRVLEENADVPPRQLCRPLLQMTLAAATAGEFPVARRLRDALAELAKIDRPKAGPYAEYAAGVVARAEGKAEAAAAAFGRSAAGFAALDSPDEEIDARYRWVDALIRVGDADGAEKVAAAAVALARKLNRPDELARALSNHGFTLRFQGHYAAAAAEYRAALKIEDGLPNTRGKASTLNNLGEVERLAGNPEAAKEALQEALTLTDQQGDTPTRGFVLLNLAGIAHDEGRYDDSLAGCAKAAAVFRRVRHPFGEMAANNSAALVHMDRGAYEDGLKVFRESLDTAEALGDSPAVVTALINIGQCHRHLGQYSDALNVFLRALALADRTREHPAAALASRGLGVVCWHLAGLDPEVFVHLVVSLSAVNRTGDLGAIAKIHQALGVLYTEVGNVNRATYHSRRAALIARATGDRKTLAEALMGLAVYSTHRGDDDAAARLYRQAQGIARQAGLLELELGITFNLVSRGIEAWMNDQAVAELAALLKRVTDLGNPHLERKIRVLAGQALAAAGKPDEAAAEFARVLGPDGTGGDHDTQFRTHVGLGRIARARQDWKTAAGHFGAAVEIAERVRAMIRDPELATGYFGNVASAYEGLAECRAERGDSTGAFEMIERARARTLAQILQNGRLPITRGMTPAERDAEREHVRVVTERANALAAAEARLAGEDVVRESRRRLNAAHDRLTEFRTRLYLAHPELQTKRAEFAPADLDRVGAVLFRDRPGLVVLSHLVTADRTYVFVLTAGDLPGGPARLAVYPVVVPKNRLTKAVADFVQGCEKPGLAPTSRDLVRWLLTPAGREIDAAKEVVVVPTDPLHRLPFHALRARFDDPYPVERAPFSYAPSVTALVKMTDLADRRRQERAGRPTALAVGISDFQGREAPLPEAEKEARAVEARFRAVDDAAAVGLLGRDATKPQVQARWAGRRYLHFATHGEFQPVTPLFSSLLLAPAGKEGDADRDEGRLYARDLLDADLAAELAVLSACRTGVGLEVTGEGLQGMSWGWFVAGVPSLVVSRWGVDDAGTAKLMTEFYARLLDGETKAEALRRAQLALLRDPATSHPYYWAPFVVVGDARE